MKSKPDVDAELSWAQVHAFRLASAVVRQIKLRAGELAQVLGASKSVVGVA